MSFADFKFSFPSTIRKGFPVVVTAWIGQPDPTVGIPNHYVNDMDIRTERDHPISTNKLAEADWIRLSAEALTTFNKLMREASND